MEQKMSVSWAQHEALEGRWKRNTVWISKDEETYVELIDLLLRVSLVQDNLAAINDEALKLVRQDSLNRRALEDLSDLGDSGGDLSVGSSDADQAVGDLSSVVGSADNISGTTSGGGLGGGSNDDGGGGLRDETVDLDSQIANIE